MLNEKFQKFGKKSNTVTKERFPNAVIYTRVSTLKQENNFSLENQLEKCEKCAINNNLNVVERFGGALKINLQREQGTEFIIELPVVKS